VIAIFGALPVETNFLKKYMFVKKTSVYRHCRIQEGRFGDIDSLLVTTGVGKEKAIRAADYVLNHFPVSLVISTGFGGGLNDKTARGDIVVYAEFTCENRPGEELSADSVLHSDSYLVSIAERALIKSKYPYLIGKGISSVYAQTTPESKYKLGASYLADAIDMESYWIGQIAIEKRIPFIAIRPLLDAVNDDLSALESIFSAEKIVPLKALTYFTRHPSQIKEVLKFSSDSGKTGKAMALFIRDYIAVI